MNRAYYDVIVVGGGPAGLAAALSAREHGAARVLLLERNASLGGILNQCIHSGFGLHHFQEELTGPEYAERFIRQLSGSGVEVLCGAMVLEVRPDRSLCAIHPQRGYLQLRAGAVVLAMGCRERTRGAIGIPGTRPAGIFTAGAAQLYMNIEGYQVGRRAVILGSGDIGLIMARRLTLESASVEGVYELMPYSGGLVRNIVQCLHDFEIPLHLSHTLTDIRGDKRVEEVEVAQVDADFQPIEATRRAVPCDTVLLSVGLIPENELSRAVGLEIDPRTGGPVLYENRECSLPGIFAAGNVAHVHDIVDFVTSESQLAGRSAALFVPEKNPRRCLHLQNGEGIGYTVPQRIRPENIENNVEVFFRVKKVYKNATIGLSSGDTLLAQYRRERLAPGEMEKITLPRKIVEKIELNKAILSVKEGISP
ncbi:NAD(P)/FAD-dependent oxidoreductase [Ruminococcaceae bacterium OttesenSCG-928-I18]|nr:NAD(P)/FAD-dependent oxidoreductase [Ruminococcaceae bacterium OttesenSCG-928-I18]